MALDLSSFLDNPYEAELDNDIPTPIAPARPGGVIYATDQNGNPIVITPTTATNTVTGQIIPTSPSPTARESSLGLGAGATPNVAAVPSLMTPGSYVSQITTWIQAHLEDFVFILIGIVLLGGAVFSFKGTQTVIENAGKVAAKVAAA